MINRRQFLAGTGGYAVFAGLSNTALGLAHGKAGPKKITGDPLADAEGVRRNIWVKPHAVDLAMSSAPLPFYPEFTGDAFPQFAHLVLPNKGHYLGPGRKPPEPEEFVDLAIVGGGLGGLTAAYALRHRNPVVIEYADRFGGNSRGETWKGTPYSMGGAYLIDPDPGPLRETLKELNLHKVLRPYSGDDAIEVGGKILPKFWDGQGSPPAQQKQFQIYRERMQYYAFQDYPNMPTPDGSLSPTVQDLDTRSLKQEISGWLEGNVPELLEAAIQLYCYSSFNAGWEEVSAASGLNFLAAEEFDLWVYPGGLGQVSRRLWQKLLETTGPQNLRPGLLVFDVRLHKQGVQITTINEKEEVRSIVARTALMGGMKKLYPFLHDDASQDRVNAIHEMKYRSYVVANVLIDQGLPDEFYDLFLIRDGVPTSAEQATDEHRITDAVSATWVTMGGGDRSVLTCYWPMPFDPTALHYTFGAWGHDAEDNFRAQTSTAVLKLLSILDIPPSAVRQIRLTRWAHAMPLPPVGFYNAGYHNTLRAPVEDRIFFANADNWALPALETAMLEAFHYAEQIDDILSRG